MKDNIVYDTKEFWNILINSHNKNIDNKGLPMEAKMWLWSNIIYHFNKLGGKQDLIINENNGLHLMFNYIRKHMDKEYRPSK